MDIIPGCPLFKKKPQELTPAQRLANEQGLKRTSPMKEIYTWGRRAVSPFIHVKDLNNPSGDQDGRRAHTAVEAGVKFSF